MNVVTAVTVIIPSLDPDEKLAATVAGLEDAGFDDIILVDDGSSPEHLAAFPDPAKHPSCTLLRHDVNRGKGQALKTGFAEFLRGRSDRVGVITVDGDGQHLVQDVLNCARKMCESGSVVLGVRDFSLPQVPPRSRAGNRITSTVFRLLCGIRISDTQTGLRAIPRQYVEPLCATRGERYDYETNMLLDIHTLRIPLNEVPIAVVYEDDNRGSHFHTIRDSLRVYKFAFKYVFSSCAAAAVDLGAFYLLELLLVPVLGAASVAVCTVGARVLSSLTNYTVNRSTVFRRGAKGTLLRYYALAVPQMAVSALLVYLLSQLSGVAGAGVTTLIKLVVDGVLFFVSYRIQQNWVFARYGTKK